jgi:hypothetical protein
VPLTLERFRICELYAELLHCSNMALFNRRPGSGPVYDDTGHLVGGLDSLDILSVALARDGVTGEKNGSLLGPDSDERLVSSFSSPSLLSDSFGDESDSRDDRNVKRNPLFNGTYDVTPPGKLLKRRFLDHNVVETMLVRLCSRRARN